MKPLVAVLALTVLSFGQASGRKETFRSIEINNYGETRPIETACEKTTAPVAKDTPNPVLNPGTFVKVNLIVGWDGKVYSPIILSSSRGVSPNVLRVLKSWRYDPATCNDIPVSSEGEITFH
jgi:hypothetical protein